MPTRCMARSETPCSRRTAEYMAHVLLAQRPDIVLLFGKQAQGGWDKMARPSNDHIVLRSVHPMARGSAARHLEKIVRDLKMLIS